MKSDRVSVSSGWKSAVGTQSEGREEKEGGYGRIGERGEKEVMTKGCKRKGKRKTCG